MTASDPHLPAVFYDPAINDLLPRAGMPQHALDELEVDRLNEMRRRDEWGNQ